MFTYYTIEDAIEVEIVIKKSKFIAYLFPINSLADFEQHLNNIKIKHPKANHHCYAYKLGTPLNIYRVNDDGEPSGTAGKPIFGQIESASCTNVLAIVVRYFGGIQLGTSGLIKAYKSSTKLAFENSIIIEKQIVDVIKLKVENAYTFELLNIIKKFKLEYNQNFSSPYDEFEIKCYKSMTQNLIVVFKKIRTLELVKIP